MAETIWIIDPDDRSGSALEALLSEISLTVERKVEAKGQAPDLLILAGSLNDEELSTHLQAFRSLPLGDVAAVVILGGSGDAGHALALGADLFVAAPTNLEAFLQTIEPFVKIPIPIDAAERRILTSRGGDVEPISAPDESDEQGTMAERESSTPPPTFTDEQSKPSATTIDPSQSISPPPLGKDGDLSSGMLQVIAERRDVEIHHEVVTESESESESESPPDMELSQSIEPEQEAVDEPAQPDEPEQEAVDEPTRPDQPEPEAVDEPPQSDEPEPETVVEALQAVEPEPEAIVEPFETPGKEPSAAEQPIKTQAAEESFETPDITDPEPELEEETSTPQWDNDSSESHSEATFFSHDADANDESWSVADSPTSDGWDQHDPEDQGDPIDSGWGNEKTISDEVSKAKSDSQWKAPEDFDGDTPNPVLPSEAAGHVDLWSDETEEANDWSTDSTEDGTWDKSEDPSSPQKDVNPSSWQADELPSEDGTWADEHTNVENQAEWGLSSNTAWGETPSLGRDRLRRLGQQLGTDHLSFQAPLGTIGALSTTGILGLIGRLAQDQVTGRIDLYNQEQRVSLFCQEGRFISLSSPALESSLLRTAEAKGLLDSDEIRALHHLSERQHQPLVSLLMKEGVITSSEWLNLAKDCAETYLLDLASLPGGQGKYLPEAPNAWAYPLQGLSGRARILAMVPALIESSLWPAVAGGDDVRPSPPRRPLEIDFPGRQALMHCDGHQSLLQLAARFSLPIETLRQGLLAAVALGDMDVVEIGVSHLHHQQRKHRSFERSVDQIRSGDYFHVLGLADALDNQEVERAYHARLALLRTQLNSQDPLFEELLYELQEAREVLLDPHLRDQYRSSRPL